MSFRDCMIVERWDDWLIVVGSETEHVAANVSVDELVTCVRLMVKLAGLTSPNCLIAPASTSCFFTTIQGDNHLDVRDRNALAYELESHVPLDAENMVADFVISATPADRAKRNHRVAAIAVEFPRWLELAEALEQAGLVVRSIVPSAVLATRAVCQEFGVTDSSELLLVDGGRCDAIKLESESLQGWKHLVVDSETLQRHRRLDAAEVRHIVLVGADPTQRDRLIEAYGDVDVKSIDRSVEELWMDGTKLALDKPSTRWFELRRDQLGPSDPLRPILPQLRLVAVAAMACLLAMAIGGWWRSKRIENEISDLNVRQRAAFSDAFPDTQIPAALLRRVRSEHAKVIGSRGAPTDMDVPQSATDVLRELLAALPQTVRFRIKSLKILNGQVDLEIQVRTPVDAGILATSLESRGFEVEPPVTTRKDAQTFDSVLEATWTGGRNVATRQVESPQGTRLRENDSPIRVTSAATGSKP